VRNEKGEVYLINSLSIKFAMVDFTNPDAWNWMKSIIKDNLVKEGRGAGWMHDFGEYLPFDAVLFDGSDPIEYHNKYPEDWAAVVKEALDEVEGGTDIVYFMRAGSGTSSKNTRLYWMGDQMTTLDRFDGL
jgi:alpha-glucosidase